MGVGREEHHRVHEEAYHIPLYVEDQIYAVSNRVENFVPAPDIRLRLVDVAVSE